MTIEVQSWFDFVFAAHVLLMFTLFVIMGGVFYLILACLGKTKGQRRK